MREHEINPLEEVKPERGNSFSQEIEKLFAELTEQDDELTRESFRRLEERGRGRAEEAEEVIARRQQEYDRFSLDEKIAHLTNNFFMKWPGGGYREQMEEGVNAGIFKPEEVAGIKQLFTDIDQTIEELGFDRELIALVAGGNRKGEQQHARLEAVGQAFLKMIERGYAVQELRS